MRKLLSILFIVLFLVNISACTQEENALLATATTQIRTDTTTKSTIPTTKKATQATTITATKDYITTTTTEQVTTNLTTATTEQSTTNQENIDAEPYLSLEFKSNKEMIDAFKTFKTKQDILKSAGKKKSDWDYRYLINSLSEAKLISEDKSIYSIKSEIADLESIIFLGWKKLFSYKFKISKSSTIIIQFYCYEKIPVKKIKDATPQFTTTNGFNVFAQVLNDEISKYFFFVENYTVFVCENNEKQTKQFIESLDIKKINI